jgi:hypothetical protein
MEAKEEPMIELTEEQKKALAGGQPVRLRENGQEYVLLPAEVYDRITHADYDDSPWTDDEMDLLAEEAGDLLDRYQP